MVAERRRNEAQKDFEDRRETLLAEAIAAVRDSDAIARSTEMARDYIRRANDAIAHLPATEAHRCLTGLGHYLLERRS